MSPYDAENPAGRSPLRIRNAEKTPAERRANLAAAAIMIALISAAPSPAQQREQVIFLKGHGEATAEAGMSVVAAAISADYDVREVDLSASPDGLTGARVVIVAGDPDIPDAQLYEIDQYLMRGGRILFLLDAADLPESGLQSNLSESNIFGFLKTYGVVVNPDLVLDRKCSSDAKWGDVATDQPYPFWPLLPSHNISEAGPLAGVRSIQFAFTSSITTPFEMPGNTSVDVLARSSDESWTVLAYADLDPATVPPPGVREKDALRIAGDSGFSLAVSVTGEFASAFIGKKVIVQNGQDVEIVEPIGMIERSTPTAIVVFGGSTMFGDEFVRRHVENVPLLARTVDWLGRHQVRTAEGAGESSGSGGGENGERAPGSRISAIWILGVSGLAVVFVAAALLLVTHNRARRQ
ncbi:MAG: GldG family protein [Armatimonadetes bacterium]|nr:GldG family protein [Armatimonadota bacterium]